MRYFTVLSVAFVGMLSVATAMAPVAHAQEMEQSPAMTAPSMTPPSDMGQDVNQIQEASPKAGAAKHGKKHHGKKHGAKHHAKKHGKKHHKKH